MVRLKALAFALVGGEWMVADAALPYAITASCDMSQFELPLVYINQLHLQPDPLMCRPCGFCPSADSYGQLAAQGYGPTLAALARWTPRLLRRQWRAVLLGRHRRDTGLVRWLPVDVLELVGRRVLAPPDLLSLDPVRR